MLVNIKKEKLSKVAALLKKPLPKKLVSVSHKLKKKHKHIQEV